MPADSDTTFKKWSIVSEQLTSLCAINPNNKNNEDLKKILNENLSLLHINSQAIITICYFLLGIINPEERDRLIKWPIINIQTNTKFRKGLSTMVLNFQEKYPWAHVKKLPESYLVNPHACQKKVVDFILRLSNLAIHLILKDSDLLEMHSGDGLSNKETEVMGEIISKAIQWEEKLIMNNILPLDEFENIKNAVIDKCIALRKENSKLEKKINYLLKCAVAEQTINSEKDGIEGLKTSKEKCLNKLLEINLKLSKYYGASKEVLIKLKTLKNPVSLTLKNFSCESSQLNLVQETLRVCENLQKLYENISGESVLKEEENSFLKKLILARNALREENEVLMRFISKNGH